MSILITQGSGTTIATALKASAHHQRVMTHQTRVRIVVTPTLTALTYAPGVWMGAELAFANAFRGAPEAGLTDSSRIEAISGTLLGNQAPFEFDLVLLAKEMTTPPSDGATPSLAAGEAANVIQGIIQIREPDWDLGPAGMCILAKVPMVRDVFAASGETQLRVGIICQGNVTMANSTNLSLALSLVQD